MLCCRSRNAMAHAPSAARAQQHDIADSAKVNSRQREDGWSERRIAMAVIAGRGEGDPSLCVACVCQPLTRAEQSRAGGGSQQPDERIERRLSTCLNAAALPDLQQHTRDWYKLLREEEASWLLWWRCSRSHGGTGELAAVNMNCICMLSL